MPSVELDSRPGLVAVRPGRQGPERRCDQLVDGRRFALQSDLRVTAARQRAGFQPERGRIITFERLNTDPVLASCLIECAVELATAKRTHHLLHLSPSPDDRGLLVADTLEQ